MRRQNQNALIRFIFVQQSSNLGNVEYGQMSPEKNQESQNRCCHGDRRGAQKGQKCAFLVFLTGQKWLKIFFKNWHWIGCTKTFHNLKIVAFGCMLEHFTDWIIQKISGDEGRCAPFKPQHLQRGAHPPSGTPLTYLFVAKRAEKTLNFLGATFLQWNKAKQCKLRHYYVKQGLRKGGGVFSEHLTYIVDNGGERVNQGNQKNRN